MEVQEFRDIKSTQFMDKVKSYKDRGWRFANLHGSTVGNQVEIICSFSNGQELENLSFLVDKDEEVPAISPLFPAAFVGENETYDLFGVVFKGGILDFGGVFYPTSVPTPMNPGSLLAEEFLADGDEGAASSTDEGTATSPDEEVDHG